MSNCNNCSSGSCSINATGKEENFSQKKSYIRAAISFIMLIAGIIFSAADLYFFSNNWIRLAWYIIAYIPVGIPVIMEAWGSIRQKDVFSEYTLMSIGNYRGILYRRIPRRSCRNVVLCCW